MKKFLFLIVCTVSLGVFAQNMPSVAGVTFGMSYFDCKKILDDTFYGGEYSQGQDLNKSLNYYNVAIDGFGFDVAIFSFQLVGMNTTYLSEALFAIRYKVSEIDKAEYQRDVLASEYMKKYELRGVGEDRQGHAYYLLGTNPFDSEECLITIGVMNFLGHDSIFHLHTFVSYGPIDFISTKE